MNSKILQDKVKEIEDHEIEMRLLKKNEKPEDSPSNSKEKNALCSSESTVSLKHYDQLLCDLRCPGCTMRLQAPIFLCATGHSLCRICHISLQTCPICTKPMTDMRSFTLERLSGKFQFPCKNLRNGCNVRLPLELMKWHEEKCIFKKTSCFMGKVWHDCLWIGREDEWIVHCKEKHSHKILQKQDVYELMWNFETLKDNAGPILAYYLIENYGETFNLYQIHEAKTSSLLWTVMIADYKDTSLEREIHGELPRYSFEIELFNKIDQRFLLLQRFPVHLEDSDVLLDDGRCVKVHLKDIQRFLDDDKNLFYRIRITCCKIKNDRWDKLLEKAKDKLRGDSKDSSFANFDSLEEQSTFSDNVVISIDERQGKNDDILKQILRKEFPDESDESSHLLQKPPRKSLENRSEYSMGNKLHHRHTVKFSD